MLSEGQIGDLAVAHLEQLTMTKQNTQPGHASVTLQKRMEKKTAHCLRTHTIIVIQSLTR